MAVSGNKASVKVTSASFTNSTNQAATLTTATKVLKLNTEARRHWDRDSTTYPRVYVPGSTASALAKTKYVVNYVQGSVTFTTPRAAGTYTMDVSWATASSFANANQWTLNVDAGLIETNVFGSTWKTSIAGLRSATVSLSGFNPIHGGSTNPTVYDYINAETDLIVELYPVTTAGNKYEAYAWMSGDQIQAAVDAAIGESVDLTIDGTLYFTTST